jgi:hypothetical protein
MADTADLYGRKEFTSALGLAISRWALVEMQLCRLFIEFVDAKRPEAANAAFNSIRGFRVQLEMTHVAAKLFFDAPAVEERLKEWREFRNRLIKASEKRNDLAHYMMIFEARDHGVRVPFLLPNIYDENYRKERTQRISNRKDAYALEDLRAAFNTFSILERDLNSWWYEHLGPRPHSPASSEK